MRIHRLPDRVEVRDDRGTLVATVHSARPNALVLARAIGFVAMNADRATELSIAFDRVPLYDEPEDGIEQDLDPLGHAYEKDFENRPEDYPL